MKSGGNFVQMGQDWRDSHSDELDAFGEVAGKIGDLAGGLLGILSRVQSLLGKAAEKPYQARLLEARINSCKALLITLDSRTDSVHLEPLRIKLSHIEDMIQRAGARFHVSTFTDESLARSFEQASAALQEEETTLALVVRALPPLPTGWRPRGRSTSGSRRAGRRHSSRSSSSTRPGRASSGGRSASPGFSEAQNPGRSSSPGQPTLETVLSTVLESEREKFPQIRVRAVTFDAAIVDPDTQSPTDRMKACLARKAVGYEPDSGPVAPVPRVDSGPWAWQEHALPTLPLHKAPDTTPGTNGQHESGISALTASPAPDLPLPDIYMVEREAQTFWQDNVTLVFCCAVSGRQHRVATHQWNGSVSERLVSWVGKPLWTGKTWEEEMEQEAFSPAAQAELKQLLAKSGWYDSFRFDSEANCGRGAWVLKEVANAGYQPCDED